MMKMGPVKLMAVMSAKGILGKAMNHNMRPTVCTAPRQNWPFTSVGQKVLKPCNTPERNTKGKITNKPQR